MTGLLINLLHANRPNEPGRHQSPKEKVRLARLCIVRGGMVYTEGYLLRGDSMWWPFLPLISCLSVEQKQDSAHPESHLAASVEVGLIPLIITSVVPPMCLGQSVWVPQICTNHGGPLSLGCIAGCAFEDIVWFVSPPWASAICGVFEGEECLPIRHHNRIHLQKGKEIREISRALQNKTCFVFTHYKVQRVAPLI